MKNKPAEKLKEDEKQKPISVKKPAPIKEEKKPPIEKISEESLADRQLLDIMFRTSADANADNDKRRRKEREATIVLLDGRETSINQIHERFIANPAPYISLFPNENLFFTHALRVHGLAHIDPKIYVKPTCIRKFLLHAIYNRFPKSKELLRAINSVNPVGSNGFRLRKLSQHVDDEGKEQIRQYIKDANQIMSVSITEYECKEKLHTEHGVPYQTDIFKKAGNA